MSPLARRTPQDQSRGPRAYSPNEPKEFFMGRATDPWRAAETWIRRLASHSIPLHAAKGLSAHPEMAHLPAEPSICDRCDRFRRSRSAIRRPPRMVHASCPVRHQGAGWHALQAYRAIVDLAPVVAMSLFQSCRSALHPKALRARLRRGPPLKAAPIALGRSTTFTVSLKGITETQAARHSAHDHPLSRAEPSGPQFLYGDCTVRLQRTIRNTVGYEKRQPAPQTGHAAAPPSSAMKLAPVYVDVVFPTCAGPVPPQGPLQSVYREPQLSGQL
jgi:hypothetical protein